MRPFAFARPADEAEAVVKEVEALGRTAVALPLDVADTSTFAAFADALRGALAGTFGRQSIETVRGAGYRLASGS